MYRRKKWKREPQAEKWTLKVFAHNCEGTEQLRCDVTMQQAAFRIYWLLVISREAFFVSEGHRKPETYRANLCDQHKFCASRSVLL